MELTPERRKSSGVQYGPEVYKRKIIGRWVFIIIVLILKKKKKGIRGDELFFVFLEFEENTGKEGMSEMLNEFELSKQYTDFEIYMFFRMDSFKLRLI